MTRINFFFCMLHYGAFIFKVKVRVHTVNCIIKLSIKNRWNEIKVSFSLMKKRKCIFGYVSSVFIAASSLTQGKSHPNVQFVAQLFLFTLLMS
jgi:hypothetical protein